MFQDIEPLQFSNDFAWADPEPFDRVLIYRGSSVVVANTDDGVLRFPSYQALLEAGVVGSAVVAASAAKLSQSHSMSQSSSQPQSASAPSQRFSSQPQGISAQPQRTSSLPKRMDGKHLQALFLFTVGNTAYFRCEINDENLDDLLKGPLELVPVGKLRDRSPKHRVFAGMVGYEYHQFYDTHRFCGRCGTLLVHDLVERMVRCPECGCMEFSRLFPAVIVGIVDRSTDKVLVSRYAGRPFKNYALIAGFCEMGETVEQTVHREVREEVGLRVTNVRYYKSQPWPPSSSLLFGFFCDLDGDAQLRVDYHELEEAEWIDRADLPVDEDYSLTREMMDVLRRGEETLFPVL